MLLEGLKQTAEVTRTSVGPTKLHSICALLHGRVFDGEFEVKARAYQFTFAPATASLNAKQLVLNGRFVLTSPPQAPRSVDGAQATLIAMQGAVGGSLWRRQAPTATSSANEAQTGQKMTQEQGPATELQPGLHAFESPKADASGQPVVESTDALGFPGVLYFSLSGLDGQTLGVPLDLSRVQLNARLAPTENLGRDLHVAFSDLVVTLDGGPVDERAAKESVAALNRLLKKMDW